MKLPKGFTPISMGECLAYQKTKTPEFSLMLFDHLNRPHAEAEVIALEQKGLVQFAMSVKNEPSVFIAPKEAFPTESEHALAETLVSFFDVTGEFAPDGRIVSTTVNWPSLPPFKQPHWQEALERKVEAIGVMKFVERVPKDSQIYSQISWMDLQEDLDALRLAEVYSFSPDIMHAIMEGAKSIPHEAPLNSIELPKARAGWFWFAEPFPVSASPVSSDTTAALLWSWEENRLRFSAYVIEDHRAGKFQGKIVASTKWLWPADLSFHDMLGLNTRLHRDAYGPGGRFEKLPNLIGEGHTMDVVAKLSLFFLMSCVWFKQTVPGKAKLTQEPGHIERHARKRYEREFKHAPVVRVIALRKSAAQAVEHTESDGEKYHLHVRFVVSGHARLQPCGPENKDRKLIWIDPFVKGPDDAPFKEASQKVFAVIR